MPTSKKTQSNLNSDIQTINPSEVLKEIRENAQIKTQKNNKISNDSQNRVMLFKKFWGKIVKYVALAIALLITGTVAWGVNNSETVTNNTVLANTKDTTEFSIISDINFANNILTCQNNSLNDCTIKFNSVNIIGLDLIKGLEFVKDLYASSDKSYYTFNLDKTKLPTNTLTEVEILAKPDNQISYRLVRFYVILNDETKPPLADIKFANGIFLKNPVTSQCELSTLKVDENSKFKKYLQQKDCDFISESIQSMTKTLDMCYNVDTERFEGKIDYEVSNGDIYYIESATMNDGAQLLVSKSIDTLVKESLNSDLNFDIREYKYELYGSNLTIDQNATLTLILSNFSGKKEVLRLHIDIKCN